MPLILAIEPDKRQASQLTAMVRGRLHAEFVLGDTAERALAALGQRVPDLILTSPLLSPKDEAALGERLRALDGAAAHVQTLTTPVLASSSGRGLSVGSATGLLSALRRDKSSPSTSAGCDPGVFAEQCREYLERAATERQLFEEQRQVAEEAAAVKAKKAAAKIPVAASETPVVEKPAIPYIDEKPAVPYIKAETVAPAPVVERRPVRVSLPKDGAEGPASLLAAVAALAAEEDAIVTPQVAEAAHESVIAREQHVDEAVQTASEPERPIDDGNESAESHHYEFVDLDLSDMLDEPGAARARRRRLDEDDEESVAVYELDPMTLAEFEAAVPHAIAKPEIPEIDEIDQEPEHTFSETELYTPLALASALRWPMMAIAADRPRAKAAERDEMKEWLEIIEALRRDAEQIPGPRSATPSAEDPGDDGRKRRRQSSPQDEWGMYDPEQCGFQALLAKLEEISDQDDVH